MADAATFADVRGTIVTYTIIRVATPQFVNQAPFGLAVVETEDGERLLARIPDIDSGDLSIGAKVASAGSDEQGAIYQVVQ